MKDIDEITGVVLDVSLRLHRELGPGLLESVYEMLLVARLEALGLKAERQKLIAVEFDSIRLEAAFRADLLIEDRLLVELNSV